MTLPHAQALLARGGSLPPEGPPGPALLDSWGRCVAAGLDPHARLRVPVVEAQDLRRRREHSAVVRQLAQAELETLSRQIAGSNFLLAFADRDGVILDLYADNRFAMSGDNAGIVAGSCWTEALCGTNGLGTALATGAPAAVMGLEHFFVSLGEVSCIAAPVRDASGQIVGVLDASSYVESRQRHTQALVQMAATQIENGLLLHQMRRHWVLAVHPRAEFLGTLSVGLLAVDDAGRVQALNARATDLLQGLDPHTGSAFDGLFGEPFERVLARLQQEGEQRLHDAYGSSLVVTCRSRPLRPAPPSVARSLAGQRASPGLPAPRLSDGPAAGAVTHDPVVAEAYALAEAAVCRRWPLLITGETGCGKEVLARHLHHQSGCAGPFVAINCGALPAELIEAELFGYVGGAFSGARREGSPGLIASADGGTLLLDEIGELPLALQASLLRFLDDRRVRPVGGTTHRTVDLQLIAATHADLAAEVAARRFRADLLYRLDTIRIHLPPLRERRDFAAAVRAVLAGIDPQAVLGDGALERLATHPWPGNFRELRAVLCRALLRSPGRLGAAALGAALPEVPLHAAGPGPGASALQQGASERVQQAFARSGSVSATARALGISRTTVYRYLREGA